MEQTTVLAEAFGEALTPERLRVYAHDLADLDLKPLGVAFTRARRELKFFPKIAELRELAGANAKTERQVEANAAWEFANQYLQQHGVVKYDLDDRPALPPRVEYALRRIGGLWGLNQITSKSYPFLFQNFCEASEQAPMADLLALQLEEKFPPKEVLGTIRHQLPGPTARRESSTPQVLAPRFVLKKFPGELPKRLTEAQCRDRREILRQQRDKLQK